MDFFPEPPSLREGEGGAGTVSFGIISSGIRFFMSLPLGAFLGMTNCRNVIIAGAGLKTCSR
jgi:hypothetical protein